jgi:hypothetical protein
MGNSNTKPIPGNNVSKLIYLQEDDEESNRETTVAKQLGLEKSYDKYEEDCFEQYRVLAKILREDEDEYRKEVNEYRTKNNTYVITDRIILRKGEDLMMRQNIIWK